MTKDAIEALVQKVQALPDPSARQTALDLVQAVMDLHTEGIERMLEILSGLETGSASIDALASDDLVGGLLLLHDLHPLDLETRVLRALDRPEFRTRGANVEFISATNGMVRVRIDGGPALRGAVEARSYGSRAGRLRIANRRRPRRCSRLCSACRIDGGITSGRQKSLRSIARIPAHTAAGALRTVCGGSRGIPSASA